MLLLKKIALSIGSALKTEFREHGYEINYEYVGNVCTLSCATEGKIGLTSRDRRGIVSGHNVIIDKSHISTIVKIGTYNFNDTKFKAEVEVERDSDSRNVYVTIVITVTQ